MENKKVTKWKKLKVKPQKDKIEHSDEYFLIQSVHMDVLIKKRNKAQKVIDSNCEVCKKVENVENTNKLPSN